MQGIVSEICLIKICIFSGMDEKRIAEIIRKVYQIANENCVSNAKNALATHVEDEVFRNYKKKISYKTVERAFERHVFNDKTVSERSPESISLLCKYLGFDNFQDYIVKNPHINGGGAGIGGRGIDEPPKRFKWRLIITISFAFGAILATAFIFKNQIFLNENDSNKNNKTTDNPINQDIANKCMTWADSLYVIVSCDTGPRSKYGTQVKPLNRMELKNFKKVEVNAAYPFFAEDGKPLIWYYKNKDNEHEYYTAPGLHPATGETLRKITPYIIQTYVPFHNDDEQTLIKNQDKDSNKNKVSLFIFDKQQMLNEKAANSVKTYLKSNGYSITTTLLDPAEINQEVISNLRAFDYDFFQRKINGYTNYICLGEVTYDHSQSTINEDLVKCRLSLNYSIISVLNGNEVDSFSRTATGTGFNKNEAEQNALKKLFL